MKILYLGSDVFYDSFKYLVETQEVLALYTYHNDEDYFNEYLVVKEAKKHNIPVHYENLESDVIIDYFKNKGLDLIFSAEYDRIIPTPDIKEFRAINVHSSLLPVGRGYYPIESAFDLNEKMCGVTMHELVQKVDSGKILFQYGYPITDSLSSIDCYIKNNKEVIKWTKKLMEDIDGCFNNAIPQKEKMPYWKKPAIEHLTIEHSDSVKECLEKYRKYNKMSQVLVNNSRYYVASIIGSYEIIDNDYIMIDDNRCLYKVNDGHIQLELVEVRNNG